MSDISPSVRLQLEVLPDEIFLEIFQYLDPIELRSFKGLNKRIDSIAQAVKINIVVQRQEKADLDYLSSLAPTQIIRLEWRGFWSSLTLLTMTELRSLTLDCAYLSRRQLYQITEINLPCLERLTVENIDNHLRERLIQAIFYDECFPSLQICQLGFHGINGLKLNHRKSSRNNLLRSLVINKWDWNQFGTLLHLLPNLRRLETSFEEPRLSTIDSIQPHFSMHHLKITLNDPLHDLKKILKCTPNIARLRIRGKLEGNDVSGHFEEMAKLFRTLAPHLQHFDCELYCLSYHTYGEESIIQQLHPLFNKVRCLFGRDRNQCYATDIKIYPANNEYEELSSPVLNDFRTYHYDRYSSDDDKNAYDDDDYDERYGAWERNEYGNGPNMYWDAESDEWCPLP